MNGIPPLALNKIGAARYGVGLALHRGDSHLKSCCIRSRRNSWLRPSGGDRGPNILLIVGLAGSPASKVKTRSSREFDLPYRVGVRIDAIRLEVSRVLRHGREQIEDHFRKL